MTVVGVAHAYVSAIGPAGPRKFVCGVQWRVFFDADSRTDSNPHTNADADTIPNTHANTNPDTNANPCDKYRRIRGDFQLL